MTAAPIDREHLEAVLRPHGESVMLPAAAYISEDVYAWERRHISAAGWTCLGRTADLMAAGVTCRAIDVGDVGVLLMIAEDRLRAFANVCRHRGHELLPSGGSAGRRALVCPYHGWSFRLDGALRAAPGLDGAAVDLDLVELPLTIWGGWAFVNATGEAAAFGQYVGAMADLLAPYRPAGLAVGARRAYDVAANWKILVENYHECYHCPLIHPELCRVSPPNSGSNWDLPGVWVGGEMDLRTDAETMSLDGRSRGQVLPGVNPRAVRYLGLFPNLLVSAHPDYVLTHRLVPAAPDRTRVECEWLFPPDVADTSYAVDFWDVTNREDWAACESVQRGVSNPHFRPGPLAVKEDAVYQWVTLLARVYLDPDSALKTALQS